MALRNSGDLARLIAAQQDPASPEYHRWLTPDEFTSRFGPTDATSRASRDGSSGRVRRHLADASTRENSFTGTVAEAQNVFSVKIAATADGRLYSNLGDPTVPASWHRSIESIRGLDNLLHSAPLIRRSVGGLRGLGRR